MVSSSEMTARGYGAGVALIGRPVSGQVAFGVKGILDEKSPAERVEAELDTRLGHLLRLHRLKDTKAGWHRLAMILAADQSAAFRVVDSDAPKKNTRPPSITDKFLMAFLADVEVVARRFVSSHRRSPTDADVFKMLASDKYARTRAGGANGLRKRMAGWLRLGRDPAHNAVLGTVIDKTPEEFISAFNALVEQYRMEAYEKDADIVSAARLPTSTKSG